jgi:hypothetical protein
MGLPLFVAPLVVEDAVTGPTFSYEFVVQVHSFQRYEYWNQVLKDCLIRFGGNRHFDIFHYRESCCLKLVTKRFIADGTASGSFLCVHSELTTHLLESGLLHSTEGGTSIFTEQLVD